MGGFLRTLFQTPTMSQELLWGTQSEWEAAENTYGRPAQYQHLRVAESNHKQPCVALLRA